MSITSAAVDLITLINGLKVPVGSLGMTRQSMPQIDDDKLDRFIDELAERQIDMSEETVNVSELRLMQAEINKHKIWALMRVLRSKKGLRPIIITRDDYVLDGSHRMVAKLNKGPRTKIKVIRINMNALALVRMINSDRHSFGVRYRSYSGKELDGEG
ncbi:hypothetical protein [Vibrio phage YC]|uniref:ParB/Sulfiredoxin domain-containing protein n=1 Tax=Vibrio phage YC TaxID=2267403 RepID=A0A384ZRZ4_9CAUD|nr:hypothetical protein HWB64_gp034 [Vibrio phage YC]AXC34403.1 hypothetical protein [Vibrio phage YC]